MIRTRGSLVLACLMMVSACSSGSVGESAGDERVESAATTQASDGNDGEPSDDAPPGQVIEDVGFGEPPAVSTEPLDAALLADLDVVVEQLGQQLEPHHIEAVTAHNDARVAWFYSDLLRFLRPGDLQTSIREGFEELTGATVDPDRAWRDATNHLLAWDLPAFEQYSAYKAPIFLLVEPRWEQFFLDGGPDRDSAIDWRILSWGGVLIDDRPLGDPLPCSQGCIPALDDPVTTVAAAGDWYSDDSIVFGVEINGESRAYQKNIMEVHEMVNDTLGGRRIAIPYCTLCGSAQAYFTDSVPAGTEVPVLRTSGLLSWSNKVMYDLNTKSVLDTFTGQAVTGPLYDQGITLEQVTVVTSTWGDWKESHPDTTIVAWDGGIGRMYDPDPLGGRDDNGPIFPVGDVDDRYESHEPVIGVLKADGSAVAFVAAAARSELEAGRNVEVDGVRLIADGSGWRATDLAGSELVAHQAFWFAWLQFYSDGTVWEGR